MHMYHKYLKYYIVRGLFDSETSEASTDFDFVPCLSDFRMIQVYSIHFCLFTFMQLYLTSKTTTTDITSNSRDRRSHAFFLEIKFYNLKKKRRFSCTNHFYIS